MNSLISVIIPTFNRMDVIEKTLRAYLNQEGDCRPFEVIVVDDGSTDDTPRILDTLAKNAGDTLRVERQENKGPAAARNAGLQKARGSLVLFAGDDVVPTANLLEQHRMSHRDYPEIEVAVLGLITWSPDEKITPFMKWLESDGVQFNYGAIQDPRHVSAEQFYSSNLSLHRDFLLKGEVFDERFKEACWEDIDLGMRLAERGMRIIYNMNAVGFHIHPTSFKRYCKRARRAGFYEGMYNQKHSRMLRVPSRQRMLLKLFLSVILRVCTAGKLKEIGYRWSLQWYSWRGMKDYLNAQPGR